MPGSIRGLCGRRCTAGAGRTVARCFNNATKRSSGIGRPSRKPWPRSQPMRTSASASEALSRPMPTARLPKLCARSITVLQIGALTLSAAAADDERAGELHLGERQLLAPFRVA